MKKRKLLTRFLITLPLVLLNAAAIGAQQRTDAFGVGQIWVPAGKFFMGTDDSEAAFLRGQDGKPSWFEYTLQHEQPKREVEISAGFWMDVNEVTNAAFQRFIDAGGYKNQSLWSEAGWKWLQSTHPGKLPAKAVGSDANPRVNVSWFEAEAYAHWRGGALPSEAQWEYAARGPKSNLYPWGNQFDPSLLNMVNATEAQPVGAFPGGASWVGAMDMAGNVMEWVQDWFDTDYGKLLTRKDPPGPASGVAKVQKGGWYGAPRLTARSAYGHFSDPPTYSDRHIGFRIVSKP